MTHNCPAGGGGAHRKAGGQPARDQRILGIIKPGAPESERLFGAPGFCFVERMAYISTRAAVMMAME